MERLLWKRQPYPDNHVPVTFLSSLRRNPSFKPYTYWPLVFSACAIAQHLSAIFIFLAIFVRLLGQTFDPRLLVVLSLAMFVTGCVVWELLDYSWGENNQGATDRRAKTLKAAILVFLALMALSPILRTLTASTSSDSIWALSACLFLLNAALADYRSVRLSGQVREELTSILSMNAAVSAAVVLASRLRDDLSVFALTLFSVQLFALFPILRHSLQAAPSIVQVGLTVALSLLSLGLMVTLSTTTTSIALGILISTTFGAPAALVWAQRYKNELRGPWDVATPEIN
ncbi:hypothetical protein HETIRDRAFT_406947 [Heterobasidion irregulare TC 32-1]|uniref:Phosphatidylinositol N-acetylglucosaminyltransferase n=1 Tax=Heterobasidion irregulare (strain TC 32-1) TaxID=747525 RepID=W4KPB3_HETIT|nr:uncharacterized protein HETIRDRAFT_406947 [Heterobasidion irregulare TC 32-1]ETW87230.1 hypothetical protein HETIRDRAFT_406947 [Heterobasidion irregulare TC 32-1]